MTFSLSGLWRVVVGAVLAIVLFGGAARSQIAVNEEIEGAVTCQAPYGHHMVYMRKTCPLGGEKFRALDLGTYSTFGVYLDLQPASYIALPGPLPVCPSNGFVVFKKDFGEGELQRIAEIISDPDYRNSYRSEVSHYLYAHVREKLHGEHDEDLWWINLAATWEAATCGNTELYEKYARQTLEYVRRRFAALAKDDRLFEPLGLLIPNLHRRIGEFETARKAIVASFPDGKEELSPRGKISFDALSRAIEERDKRQIRAR